MGADLMGVLFIAPRVPPSNYTFSIDKIKFLVGKMSFIVRFLYFWRLVSVCFCVSLRRTGCAVQVHEDSEKDEISKIRLFTVRQVHEERRDEIWLRARRAVVLAPGGAARMA